MRKHLTPSMAVAVIALFIALSGGAYAATQITGIQIKNGTITTKDLATGAVTTTDIASDTIQSSDIDNGTITSGDIDNGTITPADLSPATTSMIQQITINTAADPADAATRAAAAAVPGAPGAKGDKGDNGLNGDKGPKGDAGPQGERGINGTDGKEGARGDQGERGLQGDKGNKGDKGDTGQQGIAGPQGIQGQPAKLGHGSDALFFAPLAASDTVIREWTMPTIQSGAYVVTVVDSIEGASVDATCDLNGETVRLTAAGQFTLSAKTQGAAKVTLSCKGTGTVSGHNVITAVGGDVLDIG